MNQLSLIHISVMNHEKQEKPRNATSNTRKTPSAHIAAPIQKKQMVQKSPSPPIKNNPDSSEETCDDRTNVSEDLLGRTTQEPLLIMKSASSHHSNTDETPRLPCEIVIPETELFTDDFVCRTEESNVISGLKEDLLVTMVFATALKRKLDDLYERVFKDDAATAVGGLTGTLGIVSTIAK